MGWQGIHNPWDTPQGQRIVIVLGECFHNFTISQHTQLDLEDEELSSFVFYTGTRFIRNDAHGRKNGDHQSSKHGVPLLH